MINRRYISLKSLLVALLVMGLIFPPSMFSGMAFALESQSGDVDGDGSAPGTVAPASQDALSQDFQTNLLTGDSSYSIPVALPPGKAGMVPSVGLSYSSSNPGKTEVGLGWSFPVARVERRGSSGRVPQFDATDTFVLSFSGISSELSAKAGAPNEFVTTDEKFLKIVKDESGNGWEVWTPTGSRYRFGFSQSELVSHEPNSIVSALAQAGVPLCASAPCEFQYVRTWALSKVINPEGYWMEYDYEIDPVGGDFYPKEIRYTFGPQGLDTKRSVKFVFGDRCPDAQVSSATCNNVMASYATGSYVEMDQRLAAIDVYSDRVGEIRFAATKLYYEAKTVHGENGAPAEWTTSESKLVRVDQVGTDGASVVNRWRFEYVARPAGWNVTTQSIPEVFAERPEEDDPFADLGVRWRRFGRARIDLIRGFKTYEYVRGTSGGDSTVTFRRASHQNQTVDPNVVSFSSNYSAMTPYFTEKRTWTNLDPVPPWCELPGGWDHPDCPSCDCSQEICQNYEPLCNGNEGYSYTRYQDQGLFVTDMNNDKRDDWVILTKKTCAGGGTNCYNKCPGAKSVNGQTYNLPDWAYVVENTCDNDTGYVVQQRAYGAQVVNLNGDGLPDLMINAQGMKKIALQTSPGVWEEHDGTMEGGLADIPYRTDQTLQVVDLNRDGLDDLVVAKGMPGGTAMTHVFYNTGRSWIRDETASNNLLHSGIALGTDGQYINDPSHSWDVRFLDVNGDGFSDLVSNCFVKLHHQNRGFVDICPQAEFPTTRCYAYDDSTFTILGRNACTPLGDFSEYFWKSDEEYMGRFANDVSIADVNADGAADFIKGNTVALANLDNHQAPGLLKRVQTPTGGEILFTYEPSSITNPQLPFTKPILKEVQTTDGRGSFYRAQYAFSGGQYDTSSDEFRGFGQATVTDAQGNMSVTLFHLEDSLRGKMQKKLQYEGTAKLLYETEFFYRQDSSEPYFTPLIRAEERKVEGLPAQAQLKQVQTAYLCQDEGGAVLDCAEGGAVVLKVEQIVGEPGVTAPQKQVNTATRYFPNWTDWLLQLPARTRIYDGTKPASVTHDYDDDENYLSQSVNIYDADGDGSFSGESWNPVGGPLTAQVVRNEVTSKFNQALFEEGPLVSVTEADYHPLYKHMIAQRDALGRETRTDYETSYAEDNLSGLQPGAHVFPTRVTNPLGHKIFKVYDIYGRPWVEVDQNRVETITEFDNFHRVTRVHIEKNGQTLGENLKFYTGFCDQTCLDSDPHSLPDADNRYVESWQKFDNSRWIKKRQYIDGLERIFITVTNGPASQSFEDGYDDVYRLTLFDDATGLNPDGTTVAKNRRLLTSPAYYASSRQQAPPAANLWHSNEKDVMDRVRLVRMPSAAGEANQIISRVEYFPDHALITDARGMLRKQYTDELGQLIRVEEFDNGSLHAMDYEYDVLGNLTRTIDSEGPITEIRHNGFGQKRWMSDPDMGIWSYQYDLAGNLTQQTDALGNRIENVYDDLSRKIKKRHFLPGNGGSGDGAADAIDVFEYDCLDSERVAGSCPVTNEGRTGRISATHNQNFSNDLTYDEWGRLESKQMTIGGETVAFSYIYNVGGAVAEMIYDTGNDLGAADLVTYHYNDAGQLSYLSSTLMNPVGSPDEVLINSVQRKANGLLSTIYFGDNAIETQYQYNETGDQRLNGIRSTYLTDLSLLMDLSYTYDKSGNVEQIADSIHQKTKNYTYDDLDRLKTAQVVETGENRTYTYDPMGNLLSVAGPYLPFGESYGAPAAPADPVTFVFDQMAPVHAPTSDNFYQYQYDDNGNLKTLTGASGSTTYHYTTFNKLKQVDEDGTPLAGYLYGPNGSRIAKTDGTGTILERYFSELEKKGNDVYSYYFVGGQRVAKRQDGSIYFFQQDHLGSVSLVTDDQGNLMLDREYYEFGALQAETLIGGFDEAHAFSDKRLDQQTKFYDFEARSYAAKSFRFIQPDSIVPDPLLPQSFNRYAYVMNNPLKYIDPSGHNQLTLTWNESQGADFYTVYWWPEEEGQDPTQAQNLESMVVGNTTSIEFINQLATCQKYNFAVTASNLAGESGFSSTVSAMARPKFNGQVSIAQGTNNLTLTIDVDNVPTDGSVIGFIRPAQGQREQDSDGNTLVTAQLVPGSVQECNGTIQFTFSAAPAASTGSMQNAQIGAYELTLLRSDYIEGKGTLIVDMPQTAADFNGDGMVDGNDLVGLALPWGTKDGQTEYRPGQAHYEDYLKSDMNGNGLVDDLHEFAPMFGVCFFGACANNP